MKTGKRILSIILISIILCLPINVFGEEALQISNFSLSAGKFDPTAEALKIKFYTNDKCITYCGIYDANGNDVVTVSNGGNIPNAGSWFFTWNGTGSNGKYVQAGIYTVGLVIADEYGNTTEPVGQDVEVFYSASSNLPQISKLTLSTNKIKAGSDKVKISFYADRVCQVYCVVYDKSNKQISRVSNGGQLNKAATWNITWSGTDSNGKYLSPGVYKIGIWLKNQSGSSKMLYASIEIAAADTSNNKTVTFKDKTLERIIRGEINKEQGNIFLSDVQKITKLEINFKLDGYDVIRNLSGIENLSNLTVLNLGNQSDAQKVTNIEPLRNLKNLTELYLDYNEVSSLQPLSGLKKLKILHIGGNKVSSIEPLRSLTNLEKLYIGIDYSNGGNKVSDLSPISGLVNLKELCLYGNDSITNIDALNGMTKLTYLNLRGLHIKSIGALADMKNLRYLNVGTSNSKISDISVLEKLTELRELDISYNKITSVEPLRNLTKLEYLAIAGNNIRKLEPLSGLVNIKSFFIGTSCAGGNPVTDFRVLKNFKSMEILGLEYMKLKNVDFLAGLTTLKWLDIKNNSITSIKPLQNMANLRYLYLKNNNISDFSPLDGIVGNLVESDMYE